MKIGIIGAGFTGLSAGYYLSKSGHTVTIFEKENYPGGLAIGFKLPHWEWSLEKHYHHWFTNDHDALSLAKDLNYDVAIKRLKTSIYLGDRVYQLDSPMHVLTFPKLPIIDKVRMASVLGILRYNPFWKPLEGIKTTSFLSSAMGKNAYQMIWEPQLTHKFGEFSNNISLAWFWARIHKRTPSLAYPDGGFLQFAEHIVNTIAQAGGTIRYNTSIEELLYNLSPYVRFRNEAENKRPHEESFDKVIVTLPSFLFTKIAPQLPTQYIRSLNSLKGLGAINLVLRLKNQFLKDNTYWLSICENNAPLMAIVEHTNFIDKSHYDNEHLVYLGNYLPHSHKYFRFSKEELLNEYDSFLKKIHPEYKKGLIDTHIFSAPFAQPIIPLYYSKLLPRITTPLKNVYLANIQQVYPWDRGTNYAVELGRKVADLIDNC